MLNKRYFGYLVISYAVFAIKFNSINLFQFISFDYFNLNMGLLDFWRGVPYSSVPNLTNYAFIDLTYTQTSVLNNMGLPISLLYSVLGDFSYGPIFLVFILSFIFVGFERLCQLSGVNSFKSMSIFFLFIPILNLIGARLFTGEIGLWFSLAFLLWGFIFYKEKKTTLSIVLICLAGFCRLEFFVIAGVFSILMIKDTLKPLLISSISVSLLLLRNYLATNEFPSLADDLGRFHDHILFYYSENNRPSIVLILERLIFHFKSLFLSFPVSELDNRKFYIDTPLNLFGFYFWVPFFCNKERTLKKWFDWPVVISSLALFLSIALISETFFIRYSITYLFLPFLCLSLFLAKEMSHKKVLIFNLLQVFSLVLFTFFYKPILEPPIALEKKSLREKIFSKEILSNRVGGYISNDFTCTDFPSVHVKGMQKIDKSCFFDREIVVASRADFGKCRFEVRSAGPLDCESYGYENNFLGTGVLKNLDKNSCFYSENFFNTIVISKIWAKKDINHSTLIEGISFKCE